MFGWWQSRDSTSQRQSSQHLTDRPETMHEAIRYFDYGQIFRMLGWVSLERHPPFPSARNTIHVHPSRRALRWHASKLRRRRSKEFIFWLESQSDRIFQSPVCLRGIFERPSTYILFSVLDTYFLLNHHYILSLLIFILYPQCFLC